MYQISMPAADARTMAYPAGSMGVMNPWKNSRDLPAILQTLRTSNLARDKVSSYIRKLQARVMVPPSLRLNVHTASLQEISPPEQQQYQHALLLCVDGIVTMILRHHGAFHQANHQTAMLKMLPGILTANQLTLSTTVTTSVLARAILSGDQEVVRQILIKHPEFKTRKLAAPMEYIGQDDGSQSMPPLQLTAAELIVIFFLAAINHHQRMLR